MRKLLPFCASLLALAVVVSGCSGGSSNTPAVQKSAVAVHISDPGTCSSRVNGQFEKVLVTISDVQIHSSSSAGPNDPGWIDLTPNLKNAPVQVDLLGIPDNQCFLATLGAATEIQPGTYQQIRLKLADNSQASKIVGTNQCPSGAANCAILDGTPPQEVQLNLPSENQTGIKIPSGQLAGGQFVVPPGHTVDLDIDVIACASVILQGNNQARLKPVLHAGEVELQATSINGTIVDDVTGNPITSGKVMVLLAQQPGTPCSGAGCVSGAAVENIVEEIPADSTSGAFIFCPVSPGVTYDVIAIAFNSPMAYAATVTTGVQAGNTLGTIRLKRAGAQATIDGTVTTTSAAPASAKVEDVTIVPMQAVTAGTANLLIPIPQFGASTRTTVTTAAVTPPTPACPSTVACANYVLKVPAANPSVGVFNAMGTTYTQSNAAVQYIVDAQAAMCAPSEMQTDQQANPPGGALTVTAGNTFTAATLAFTGCQ